MNRSTMILVALALVSAVGAWTMRPQPIPPVQFEDTGEALFPDFADPTVATALSIVAWDEEQAKVVSFEVEQKEGRWVIPSHNDYPADGTERMAKAAASFIDIEKDLYYGDDEANHAAFGVLDPDGEEGKDDERGQRITIKDAAGTVLVDIVVGKEIPDKTGFYYVRLPGEKRVYGTRLKLDISTRFEDWIEKDLLKVERDEFVRMIYNPYTVDEVEHRVSDDRRDPIVAELVDPEGSKQDWKLSEGAPAPEGKEIDSMKVRQILTAMASLKIAGVRVRPPRGGAFGDQILIQDMQRKGFFLERNPDGSAGIVGNEGELTAITEDGIVYTLLFGEVTYESGIALTAGVAPEEGGADQDGVMVEDAEEGEEGEGDTKKTASRFMFVNVMYDERFDTTLVGGSSSPEDGAEGDTEGDTEGAEGEVESTPADPEGDAKKKLEGRERAAKLAERFDKWFYVISDASFKQIHKTRDEMFKDAPVPADGGADEDAPAGGMGLPGGMMPPG